jgi:hypothetical protein
MNKWSSIYLHLARACNTLTELTGTECIEGLFIAGNLTTFADGGEWDSPIPLVVAAMEVVADSPGTRTCLNLLTARCNRSKRKVSPSKNKTPSLSLYSSWFPSNVTFGLPGRLLWNSTVTRLSLFFCREPAWVLSMDAGLNSSATSK